MLRRLLPALILSAPLLATGLMPAAAQADDTPSRFAERWATVTETFVNHAPARPGETLRVAVIVRAPSAPSAPIGGTVTFEIDGQHIAEVTAEPVNGPSDGVSSIAVLEVADLEVGTHWVDAHFSGTPEFAPSTADTQVVMVRSVPTTLAASPVFLGLHPFALPNAVLTATLTDSEGDPIVGRPVTFTAGRTALCTSTTNEQGVATCNAAPHRLALLLGGGYVATHADGAGYEPSSARGPLIG